MPMRVCHVIESAAAGSAGVMLALARHGAASGQEVSIVYSLVRASDAFLEQLATLRNVRAYDIRMERSVGLHDVAGVLQLRRLFRQAGKIDVVHSHSSKGGALARLAGVGRRAQQVYSPHGFVTMAPGSSRVYGVLERGLATLCDAVVAVSRREKDHGVALGIPERKLIVIPNGADLPHDLQVKDSGGRRLTLGFVGRLSEQKDPLLAIAAVSQALRKGADLELIMIGDGELKAETQAAVEASGFADRISLLGAARALDYYPRFDALLCSSRFEGMPLTFLEALAFGVPIISTPVGGTDELVIQDETGLLANPNPERLADSILAFERMTEDARSSMRHSCLNYAARFTTARMAERTFRLYERLLTDGPVVSD